MNSKAVLSNLREDERKIIKYVSNKYQLKELYYNLDGHDIFKRSKINILFFRG